MKMGEGIRLLYILLDGSGSFEGDEYVAEACNSLLKKKRDEAILVTVAMFGKHLMQEGVHHVYEEVPIAKAPEIHFSASGGSPIWYSIYIALKEMKISVAKYPVASVEFVIVTDFFNEQREEYHQYCTDAIKAAQEAGWQLTGLIPRGADAQRSKASAEVVGFPRDRIMEV